MSFGRKDAEEAEYRRFRYLDGDVLRNKLDIHNLDRLDRAERMLVERRLREGLPAVARAITYDGFKAIHGHLFQDVYDWAGQERTYTTGRGPSPFAPPEQIAPWMEKQFSGLAAENNLRGLKAEAFAERAAHYVNEINAVHPFIEGNGRTQRTWLRGLADQAGYTLALASHHRERWYEASKIGFHRSHAPMAALILENLSTNDGQGRTRQAGDRGKNRLVRPQRGRGHGDNDQGL